MSPWRSCSKTCGPGLQYRSVTCLHQTRNGNTEETSSDLCPSDKPSGVQNCMKKACHLNWMAGPWSQVSQYPKIYLFVSFFSISSSLLHFFQRTTQLAYSFKRRNYCIMRVRHLRMLSYSVRRQRRESKMAFSFFL